MTFSPRERISLVYPPLGAGGTVETGDNEPQVIASPTLETDSLRWTPESRQKPPEFKLHMELL